VAAEDWLRPNTMEVRTDPRVGCELAVEFWSSQMSGSLRAVSRDLSVGGICIMTRTPIDHRAIGKVRIQLPSGPLTLRTEGRWQQIHPTTGAILTGLSFKGLDAPTQDVVWDYVSEAGKQVARFLLRQSGIDGLGVDGAISLAHVSRLGLYGPGDMIYREGEEKSAPSSVLVLQEGEVVLRMRLRPAIEKDFAVLKPGEVFGGLPMLASVDQLETAVARTKVRLIEIDERAYLHLTRSRPGVAQQLAASVTKACTGRLRSALQRAS
jgi:hypothetical protein